MDHFWCDPGVRRVSTGETPWGGGQRCAAELKAIPEGLDFKGFRFRRAGPDRTENNTGWQQVNGTGWSLVMIGNSGHSRQGAP